MADRTILSYESDTMLNEYLLFHYGVEADLLPFSFGPKESLFFPVRCVTECVNMQALPPRAVGLDLGCSVGRSSFEMSKFCRRVTAIDNSHAFIDAAKEIQQVGELSYTICEEGMHEEKRQAKIPSGVYPNRVDFQCRDVMDFLHETEQFYDLVLVANLLCRLQSPTAFLEKLYKVVSPAGQLILISPYTWMEEFTHRSQWIGNGSPLKSIQNILKGYFFLHRSFDMPFLIREHRRKYEWGVSQASLWTRHSEGMFI